MTSYFAILRAIRNGRDPLGKTNVQDVRVGAVANLAPTRQSRLAPNGLAWSGA